MRPEVPLHELVSLKGRRALITGSAAGIGRAMAERFAEAGADLVLVDIDEEKLREATSELKEWNVEGRDHRERIAHVDPDVVGVGIAVPSTLYPTHL
jgi:NAD(P)-dependent dehydrogenase (short-subunit alcohol dehydrogenase family)